jgi:aminopeptidase N
VTEESLLTTAEMVSGQDLGWFFEQWLHTTATLDYSIGEIVQQEREGRWSTSVDVLREGEAWMPVTLRVGGEERTLEDRGRQQRIEFITDERPTEAILDPYGWVLDSNPANNRVDIPEPPAPFSR